MITSELITVPSFVISQESSEGATEQPIWVQYYNGTISLEQEGETINILPEMLDSIFKIIKKRLPEAEHYLNKK